MDGADVDTRTKNIMKLIPDLVSDLAERSSFDFFITKSALRRPLYR